MSSSPIEKCPVSPEQLGALIDLVTDGTISNRIAKEVFAEMFKTGVDATTIIARKKLYQISDVNVIENMIDEVLTDQADKVAKYRAGRDKLYDFFVGKVMNATQGKANPNLVNQLLKAKLTGDKAG